MPDYATMEAGPEMDVLVAEKVFGCNVKHDPAGCAYCACKTNDPVYPKHANSDGFAFVPDYSDDIVDAWEVRRHIQVEHPGWRFALLGGDGADLGNEFLPTRKRSCGEWMAEFFGHADPKQNRGQRHGHMYANTASLAICRAALMAVEKEG